VITSASYETRSDALASGIALRRRNAEARLLLGEAGAALEVGQATLAWLIADRLARHDLCSDTRPLLLRAAAFAALSEPAAASRDIERVRMLSPDSALLRNADLAGHDGTLLRRALERMLLSSDLLQRDRALQRLTSDGIDVVILAVASGAGIGASAMWNGDRPPQLAWSTGDDSGPMEVRDIVASGRSDYRWRGTLALLWPENREAVTLSSADAYSFCAPRIIYRPEEARPARLPPAASFEAGPRPLLLIVPVHGDPAATMACLDSLSAARGAGDRWRIIVVDDASPDAELSAWLGKQAEQGVFELLRNPLNLGFARSVNRGLAIRRIEEDVVLVNADTIVPPGAIGHLAAVAASDSTIGSVTPLSNNGEDTSFPRRFTANPMPDAAEIARLDRLAREVNDLNAAPMPNGVGFCLYLTREVVSALGPLSVAYGRGYYEDVDYCLQAEKAGFRNVCATGAVVGHLGSRSFKTEKHALIRTNLRAIEQRFPGYRARAMEFFRADPLKPDIARIEERWLREAGPIHLLVAPRGTPDWLLTALGKQAPSGSLSILLLPQTDTDATHYSLAAPDGMPRNVSISLRASEAADPNAIGNLLSAYPVESVLIIDPQDLPAALIHGLRMLGHPVTTMRASTHRMRQCNGLSHTDPSAAPTALFAHSFYEISACTLPSLLPDEPAASCPSTFENSRGLAILAETTTAADRRLATAFSQKASRNGSPVAFLGDPRDAPLQGIWATGPITRGETAAWLEAAGIGACLIASRRYGLADPRIGAWSAGGMAMAFFDPAQDEPMTRGNRLHIPARLKDVEAAEAVLSWLEARTTALSRLLR
jgi:GT2 family glycosyltransferase